MRIGIVEVCEGNHYTAVLALAKTYLQEPSNKVFIYTTRSIAPLFNGVSASCEIVVKPEDITLRSFLKGIASQSHDRIHINTISSSYHDFASVKWRGSIYFTIHNTDLWLDNPVGNRIKVLQDDLKRGLSNKNITAIKDTLIIFFKEFQRQNERNTFIKQLLKLDYKIIVYSEAQERHLRNYVPSDRILNFPFCLHEGYRDTSGDGYVRIAIPGSVSNLRRDYIAVFDLLEKSLVDLKSKIVVDLLGYIPKESKFLLKRISELKHKGFNIISSKGFIDVDEFDKRLQQADLILGNLKVRLNRFRKYGETKETGVTFNVIKSGKPGLLPIEYPIESNLAPACMQFNSYEELGKQIRQLTEEPGRLHALKALARQAVTNYTPEVLYKRLIQ